MEEGHSDIFVYNYRGRAPDTKIGRVFVNDKDDWDLPDKTFKFKRTVRHGFKLSRHTGMITMPKGIKLPQEINTFLLEFLVEDPIHNQVGSKAVSATVNITVQKIPEEAVTTSGSVRIRGTPEDFIKPDGNGYSKRDQFRSLMSRYLNATYVDVFTVLDATNKNREPFTDVRFSAHGSPYLKTERLEGVLTRRRHDVEKSLGIDIAMIHIDECIHEGSSGCSGSCVNDLVIDEQPVSVFTNTTSFVGVAARVKPICGCNAPEKKRSCESRPCLNGGTCTDTYNGYKCDCPADNGFGSNCERLAASFNGQGWSWHPGIQACGNSHLSMTFNTQADYGTLLYVGPSPNNIVEKVSDFMALEIVSGKLVMMINFGSGTRKLQLEQRVSEIYRVARMAVENVLSNMWTATVAVISKFDVNQTFSTTIRSTTESPCSLLLGLQSLISPFTLLLFPRRLTTALTTTS